MAITANKNLLCSLWQKRMQVPQGWLCWLPPEELLTFLRANKQIDLGLMKVKDSVGGNQLSVLIQDESHARRKTRKLLRDGQILSEGPEQGKLQRL